jgi:hypothetical protein
MTFYRFSKTGKRTFDHMLKFRNLILFPWLRLSQLLQSRSISGITSRMVTQRQINLLRGWPNAALLPTASILRASQVALSDPSISTPGLLYGPDAGYQPLREEIADWTSNFFSGEKENLVADPERICISGGASQNLACVLQVFTDPLKTRVWMVAPCYFLACRIFEDSGLKCRGIGEGKEGVDIEALEKELERVEKEEGDVEVHIAHLHQLRLTIYSHIADVETSNSMVKNLSPHHLLRPNLLKSLRENHDAFRPQESRHAGPQVRRVDHYR